MWPWSLISVSFAAGHYHARKIKNGKWILILFFFFFSFKGTFTVPVSQLATPEKKKLLVRQIDGKAVDALKEKIIQHPNGFYPRIPVIARNLTSANDFKEEDLPSLRLETLGNNHLRRASQELIQDQRFAECQFVANRRRGYYICWSNRRRGGSAGDPALASTGSE